jgi:hypothetical protein
LCDGLKNYPHFSPIKKLCFISRSTSGISQIGCLDDQGVISVWNIIELSSHMISDDDLHLSLGGKWKMVLIYSDNLMDYPNVIDPFQMDDLTGSIEIEFDPTEP